MARPSFPLAIAVFFSLSTAAASTYEVGDGRPYANIGAVPWESLQPDDTVIIYGRETPYREKWVICRQGTAAAPITVRGALGPQGQLPIIDGAGATTRLQLEYWNEERSLLKIGGASIPPDTMPRHILVENLTFQNAHMSGSFTDDSGAVRAYIANAAGIFVEKGENITIRDCTLIGNGNGLFVASSDANVSRDILIEGCTIGGNGNVGSLFEHNVYTAAAGITFQGNTLLPPRAGALGNNLKDRSAGLVVRYNRISGGNRQLDLVDAEDSAVLRADPRYRTTFVYGNSLEERPGDGNRQIVHYGGDSGNEPTYRHGTLHFYHNTVRSLRTDRTTLFRLSTNDEHCDARNNIFHGVHAGNQMALVDATGVLDLTHNWFKPGYIATFGTLEGTINDDGTSVLAADPLFAERFGHTDFISCDSTCVNAAAAPHPDVLPAHALNRQYYRTNDTIVRPILGAAADIGADEAGNLRADLDHDGVVNLADLATLLASFGTSAGATFEQGDVDGDADVDLSDLTLLLVDYGFGCA